MHLRLSAYEDLCLYEDLFKYCFNNLCFQLPKNEMNEITPAVRHKWGKISSSYLFK